MEAQTKGVKPTSHLDPVLSIEDAQGQPLHTCRNPGDDHLRTPGVDDSTPDAFDDLCINDDMNSETKDSKLEVMVPPAASRNLYVHVIDWNQTVQGRKNYRLVVSGATAN